MQMNKNNIKIWDFKIKEVLEISILVHFLVKIKINNKDKMFILISMNFLTFQTKIKEKLIDLFEDQILF